MYEFFIRFLFPMAEIEWNNTFHTSTNFRLCFWWIRSRSLFNTSDSADLLKEYYSVVLILAKDAECISRLVYVSQDARRPSTPE